MPIINIVLIGPTNSGKTHLSKSLSTEVSDLSAKNVIIERIKSLFILEKRQVFFSSSFEKIPRNKIQVVFKDTNGDINSHQEKIDIFTPLFLVCDLYQLSHQPNEYEVKLNEFYKYHIQNKPLRNVWMIGTKGDLLDTEHDVKASRQFLDLGKRYKIPKEHIIFSHQIIPNNLLDQTIFLEPPALIRNVGFEM